ncbi:hypothetical protein GPECTOR_10g793 [Gonium pectorale]|uniref:Uncharacterized protein n=1 Tax=Gonium pectorale TaxID=33097 RepID=A0A150GQU2_GONPE|nr:hypothetical protein GPECTOR_10g793 [Gonium pectorale]|eukprot:KXZ52164.1 hypothetical protein GPECTOR_10g793 [Gonium pectorale]
MTGTLYTGKTSVITLTARFRDGWWIFSVPGSLNGRFMKLRVKLDGRVLTWTDTKDDSQQDVCVVRLLDNVEKTGKSAGTRHTVLTGVPRELRKQIIGAFQLGFVGDPNQGDGVITLITSSAPLPVLAPGDPEPAFDDDLPPPSAASASASASASAARPTSGAQPTSSSAPVGSGNPSAKARPGRPRSTRASAASSSSCPSPAVVSEPQSTNLSPPIKPNEMDLWRAAVMTSGQLLLALLTAWGPAAAGGAGSSDARSREAALARCFTNLRSAKVELEDRPGA